MAGADGDTDGIIDCNAVFPLLLDGLKLSGHHLRLTVYNILILDIEQKDQEFVSSQPSHDGIRIKDILQFVRDSCQHLVAVHVAEGIVDIFKIVHVNDEKCTLLLTVLI